MTERLCAACHYPAADSHGILCDWCWETLIAGSAVASSIGAYVTIGAVDREMAVLAADFIDRAYQERGGA